MKFGQRIGNFMKNDSLPLTAEAKELVEKTTKNAKQLHINCAVITLTGRKFVLKPPLP